MFEINRTKQRIVGVSTAYVATLAVLGVSTPASGTPAGDRDIHSAICHFATDNVGSTLDNSGALTNNDASLTRFVYCPMISDDALDTDDVTGVDVWGLEASGSAVSRTCAHFPLTTGFVCATQTSWSAGPGEVASNLSVSEWSSGSYFAYMRHDLTPGSSLFGMQLE